ncbi:MAG: plasmid mobilization protein [Sporichthyaceae bacterium]
MAESETSGEQAPTRGGHGLRGLRQVRAPGRPRPVSHRVKVTAEQEKRLAALAAERQITVARLLVESALAGGADAAKAKAELAGELFRISRLLGKVGVNINQIARATNATLERQPETAGAIQALGRVCQRLELLLDDVDAGARTGAESGARP